MVFFSLNLFWLLQLQTDESVLPLDNSFATLEFMPEESVTSKGKQTKVKLNPEIEKLAAKFDEEQSDEDEDVFETEFAMHKRDYYIQKFGYEEVNRYGPYYRPLNHFT